MFDFFLKSYEKLGRVNYMYMYIYIEIIGQISCVMILFVKLGNIRIYYVYKHDSTI